MFTLFLRAVLLYAFMILTLRALGKRQLGELQPYELALTILLADIISSPMESVSTPLLYGLIPVAAVFVLHGTITLLSMRSDKMRAFLSGKPTMLMSRGVIDRQALSKLCLSLSDLLEALRSDGYLDPSEVETVVVEANGTLNAFPAAKFRPANTQEMQVAAGYEGMPAILIMDGRVQENNLKLTGKNRAWLDRLLSGRGTGTQGVFLASLNTQGQMLLQLMDGSVSQFQALPESEVRW